MSLCARTVSILNVQQLQSRHLLTKITGMLTIITTSHHRTPPPDSPHLVVIREGDDGGTHPQDHGWVDLTVGVRRAVGRVLVLHKVIRGHGQHDGLFLQGVNVFHHTAGHQVLPAGQRDEQPIRYVFTGGTAIPSKPHGSLHYLTD